MLMKSLSIVIPCFNEQRNLPGLFSALEGFLRTKDCPASEIVFVNDGSTDQTDTLLRDFIGRHPDVARIISYPENKGKGFAVRAGMLGAKGEWRLFMDADLAVPLETVENLLPLMARGCEVIIGSRVIAGSSVALPQGKVRSFLGGCFTVLANGITGVRVSDFTCGFKCFSKKATETIFPLAKIDRWSYDAEILYLARKHSFEICEVGVVWKNGPETKVSFIRGDMFRAFTDLLRIIRIHR